jgi:hypothetical protein
MAGHRRLNRVAGIAATVLVALAGAIAVLLIFEGRDSSQVQHAAGAAAGPGRLLPDQGDAHLRAGAPRPRYVSDPPASGAHVPVAIRSDPDGTQLSDDQLLEALSLGDVVLLYGGERSPAGLRALADRLAGPFDPALAASGQAVVLARRPGTRGVMALAWRHELRARSGRDPALEGFVSYWLGRGASG